MSNHRVYLKNIGFTLGGAIFFSANCAIAQITQDNTLPTNSQVSTQGNITSIDGGTQVGSNLFHSFKEFSIFNGYTAEFKNAKDVQNIISRVTGNSVSHIDGILKTQGTANLFLINPNGIIFGSTATLDISGSFIASTANSLNFEDGIKFSATEPQSTPLLSVKVPIGLQFGASAAPIINQSQAQPNGATNSFGLPVGLQVKPDKTLALVGGDITLEGGNLTAVSGRIELGSVAENSLVSLNPTTQGWVLGYENVQNFRNIQLIQRNVNGSIISSRVDASNRDGSKGNIQVQGNTVELIGNVSISTQTTGAKDGGELTINAKKLILRDGAGVYTVTSGQGRGGNLSVNASEAVEVIGFYTRPNNRGIIPSVLSSSTGVAGKAGDININTGRLRIQDEGQVATNSIASSIGSQIMPGTGAGGNLTINATESIELIGNLTNRNRTGLFASTYTSGDAGQVTINTRQLIIRNGARITVSSQFASNYTYPSNTYVLGKAGEINVTANSILLDNGRITSNSESGQGGNITLQVRDLLSMRRNSQITTNAGADGNGGNITINAPDGLVFAAALENSDITANAFFGSGGKIKINADSIFGFVQRDRTQNPDTNDITAFSEQNPSLNGTVEINSPDVDPSQGLVELPVNTVDAQDKIVAGCNSAQRIASASFIATGRGGIASSPTDTLIGDAILTDWIALEEQDENRAASVQNRPVTQNQYTQKADSVNSSAQIVEAQGWVMDNDGNVVLVAQAPTVTPHSSALNPASCAVN